MAVCPLSLCLFTSVFLSPCLRPSPFSGCFSLPSLLWLAAFSGYHLRLSFSPLWLSARFPSVFSRLSSFRLVFGLLLLAAAFLYHRFYDWLILVAIIFVCFFLRYGCPPAFPLSFHVSLPFALSAFPLFSAFSF